MFRIDGPGLYELPPQPLGHVHLNWLPVEKRIQLKILVLVHAAPYSKKARRCASHRCSVIIHHAGSCTFWQCLAIRRPARAFTYNGFFAAGRLSVLGLHFGIRCHLNCVQLTTLISLEFLKLIPLEYLSPIHTV